MTVNRLSVVIRANQLAKAHLVTAEERIKKDNIRGALEAMTAAIRENQTAVNAVASLAFQSRRKVRT